MKDLFLGLDCSTQSLTGLIIDFKSRKVIYRDVVNFDEELPRYQTQNGAIYLDNNNTIHSYPLMWIEALELLFNKFCNDDIPLFEIKSISGSAQQHGTVYLNAKFETVLLNLDIKKSLVSQLKPTLSKLTSPIWMDSSTSKQCQEIRGKLGGLKSSVSLLGSDIVERFSGPQIRKFFQENLQKYNHTTIIHLVSSFLASILLGKNAPIDHGDGAGMNLMNIMTKEWDDRALEATAPNLKNKLPFLSFSQAIIGNISTYFVKKYDFNPDTNLIAWSGDNPNSLIGVGLIKKGMAAISLGTSDTYFSYLQNLYFDYNGEGHVFGAPTGDYMSLICFKNGSLAREKVKNKFKLDWESFTKILNKTPPGNNGKIMLPYFFPEIVPKVLKPKVYRFGFDEKDVYGNIRGIIEAQFLALRLHSKWIGEKPIEIYSTGGASVNKEILKVLANIFNIKVRMFEITDSAALGAALRAIKTYYDTKNEKKSWNEIIEKFINFQNSIIIEPNTKYIELYNDMVNLYDKCERFILQNGDNPESTRLQFIKRYYKLF
jgi:xylulokinase